MDVLVAALILAAPETVVRPQRTLVDLVDLTRDDDDQSYEAQMMAEGQVAANVMGWSMATIAIPTVIVGAVLWTDDDPEARSIGTAAAVTGLAFAGLGAFVGWLVAPSDGSIENLERRYNARHPETPIELRRD